MPGAPSPRPARPRTGSPGSCWRAIDGPGGTAEPMDEWILGWLARTAELLVGQAPQVAAELLRQAVGELPGWLGPA